MPIQKGNGSNLWTLWFLNNSPRIVAGSGSGGDRRAFDFIAAFPHSDAQFDANAGDLALGTDVYFFSAFLSKPTSLATTFWVLETSVSDKRMLVSRAISPNLRIRSQPDPNDGDVESRMIQSWTLIAVAFLFNWIGFLLLMCVCHTVAGRYGALAGFGLSLAKWTLIVKHSTDLASGTNNWLWWLIMSFGTSPHPKTLYS